MLAIVDYDCGNLGSIRNMLKKIGVLDVEITRDVEAIRSADRIILPGVGSFDTGMNQIRQFGLEDVLNKCVLEDRKPTLGICLGMQLLLSGSDEGEAPGLDWIKGRAVRFQPCSEGKYKVPHMGWNSVEPAGGHTLFDGQPEEFGFYFVHSYFAVCESEADVAGWTQHGQKFACAVAKDNVWGVQFHPEKSHKYGMQLLRNFVENA